VIVLLGCATIVVVVAGLRGVADIVGPVFLALMLTVTVSPLTGWLRGRGVPIWLATGATLITTFAILVLLGGALVVSLYRLVDLLPEYQAQFASLRDDLARQLNSVGISTQEVRDFIASADPRTVASWVESLAGGLASLLSNTVFLIAVLLFMCIDAVHFPARLRSVAGDRPQVVTALRSFSQGTRRYLLVSTVFGLIVAVVDTLMLWALGVPLPVLWGLLAFITNYIPNVGFVVGLIPPALLALLQGGVDLMVTVIVLYCVVNFIIQSVIQPKIVGDAVGLSATVSFLSLVFWAWVLGGLGALLAIPLTLLAKGLLIDVDPSTGWINSLLAGGSLPKESSGRRDKAPPAPDIHDGAAAPPPLTKSPGSTA
jgi:predicted PurR-regulated permease PerM